MEQGLKEFIEETRRIIPSHFGRIITPLLSNVDNSEPNPLYYQENILIFKVLNLDYYFEIFFLVLGKIKYYEEITTAIVRYYII